MKQHMWKRTELRIDTGSGSVSAVLDMPPDPEALFVLAHGAGAGMRHPFMEDLARCLCDEQVATLRYQFPYTERKSKRPDHRSVLIATVRSAVEAGRRVCPSLPLIAGGKSMGGRMTSLAASEEPLLEVSGIVFVGFPLHPPGKPSIDRAAHLEEVRVSMLFLQGTRDKLADLSLLEPVCSRLGRRATLSVIEGGDHSFHMPKRSGRTDGDVLRELAGTIRKWSAPLLHG